MDVLNKLVTAIKGGVTEVGEAIVDSQALRILDQEIREAIEALNDTKDSLAATIARQKLSAEKTGKISDDIVENEGYARKALEQGDEKLALDVAEKIAGLETKLATEKAAGEGFADSAERLRNAIARADNDVQHMKTQVDTVRATENVQKAEAAVSERHRGSNSKLRTAMESLERIKEKQAQTGAHMSAAKEMVDHSDDASLDKRLEEAGIKKTNNASDVLERIKQDCT